MIKYKKYTNKITLTINKCETSFLKRNDQNIINIFKYVFKTIN
jgi:hypothetical protein